jgi:sRNA-binding regulator protein Hfq
LRWILLLSGWAGLDTRHFLPASDRKTRTTASRIQQLDFHKQTMADSSAIPVRRIYDARQAKAKGKEDGANPSILPSISPTGPRKLIRPPMPPNARRDPARVSAISSAFTNPTRLDTAVVRGESSHAEAYYFQKQIHSRTVMIFVLEDGEQIEGTIEWYDRYSIKVRHGALRTLIYKAGIKYLYKAMDTNQLNGRP